jgi:hypothetical protein
MLCGTRFVVVCWGVIVQHRCGTVCLHGRQGQRLYTTPPRTTIMVVACAATCHGVIMQHSLACCVVGTHPIMDGVQHVPAEDCLSTKGREANQQTLGAGGVRPQPVTPAAVKPCTPSVA